MVKIWLLILLCLFFGHLSYSQNYNSLANGSWTTLANWNNSSGFGSATPDLAGGHTSGTAVVNHNLAITGNYVLGSATLQINAGKTVTVSGDFTVNGGATVNVSGILQIDGNVTLNSNLNILPGGQVIVKGSITVVSSTYLNIGTAAVPPPYADLVVYQNLISSSSGDVTVNQNGRVAIFGNVIDTGGGGTLFTVNNGGQVYVNGNINFTGGGSSITNNNSSSPFGLYVKGTTTNSGGGSSTTSNQANLPTLQSTNVPFYNWVKAIPSSPLPIELLYFSGKQEGNKIHLQWATASELNFHRFIIEHSTNGLDFTALFEQPGAGHNTNETHRYDYTHQSYVRGKNYYRLKSVDLDGLFEYSDVIIVEADEQITVSIFPNPVYDYLIIRTNVESNQSDCISITDSYGYEVFRTPVSSLETKIELSGSVIPGIYFVQYKGTFLTRTMRIIVK
jgi:Secretion system C-terminal sorting domain